MITLEQIRLLEERVRRAVDRISALYQENEELRKKAEEYEARVGELEARIDRFTRDQNEIEVGIKKALDSLEGIEGQASGGGSEEPTPETESSPEAEESVYEPAEAGSAEGPDKGSEVEESNELDIF